MSGEAWLFLFSVLINAVNLFLQVFFTIMYSDLEWYVVSLRFVQDTEKDELLLLDSVYCLCPATCGDCMLTSCATATISTPSTSATA